MLSMKQEVVVNGYELQPLHLSFPFQLIHTGSLLLDHVHAEKVLITPLVALLYNIPASLKVLVSDEKEHGLCNVGGTEIACRRLTSCYYHTHIKARNYTCHVTCILSLVSQENQLLHHHNRKNV